MAPPVINDDMHDPEFRRLLAQEELILEVTEVLCGLLGEEKISRKELADRLGKTKGFVSQLLNGGRNITLRTVADILHALGYKVSLTPEKIKQKSNIIGFQPIRKRIVMNKSRTWEDSPWDYKWGGLKRIYPDNYPDKAAIFG